mgnify:CR=1 FL=1
MRIRTISMALVSAAMLAGVSAKADFTPIAQIGVTENIFLDADIPWSYTGTSEFLANFSKAVFGLPSIGAHFAARHGTDCIVGQSASSVIFCAIRSAARPSV